MIIETRYGKIEGSKEKGMYAFKGIPFAEAPVGRYRFKPPVPVKPWPGILAADHFGKRAVQTQEQGYKDNLGFSEDCLNLNVWMPDTGQKKMPVVFYIHGGGHFSGANSDTWFDGPHLIKDRQAVMVAPNYRLGAFGYLYLGEILGEDYADSGNLGLLDQILALKWVQENIEAFGGDPDNVVLMGQSAGGKSVANLLVTPAAKGLFKRAVIQSGSVQCIRDTHTATQIANTVIQKLGITKEPEKLLDVSSEMLLEAQKQAYEVHDRSHMFGPVIDGRTLFEKPERYIASGKLDIMDILIGYNKEELCYCQKGQKRSEQETIRAFQKCYGLQWEITYRKYLEYAKTNSTAEAFDMVQTMCVYGNAAISLSQLLASSGCRVWSYRWDYGINGGRAQHFSEMPYLFGYILDPDYEHYNPMEEEMAERMNSTWMSFIMTGSPENELIPAWYPCTTSEMGYRMYFDTQTHLEQFNLRSYYQEFPMQVIRL